MARVLVTGADGFAGSYVAAALAARGHTVIGMTKSVAHRAIDSISEWQHADLADPEATRLALAAAQPDRVLHLAAISFVAHSDIADIYASNVVGTRNLLEAIAALGAREGLAIIVSSANVYGNHVGGILHEDLPLDPRSDYAVSKVACEYLASMYADRVASLVVRPFNYTGLGQSTRFIIPKIVDHVRRGVDLIELGNLDVARDFSDVRFFADALVRLLDVPSARGNTVNICSGHAYTLAEVLAMIAEISGHQLEVKANQAFMRANEVERLWGDNSKLQRLIGPVSGPPLTETLRWMLEA